MCKVLREVCTAIVELLGKELIKFPREEEEIKKTMKSFERKFGFPQVLGCIDGTHIPIGRPKENSHDYFCYKMKISLNVQAICDADGLFIDVDCRWPGSLHDARVFKCSAVSKLFSEQKLPSTTSRILIPGENPVPPILIGEPAYPLLPNVMKEYPNTMSNKQVMFNEMLRSTRNIIERAFGKLKGRWRILNRPLDIDIDFAPTIIMSCFILHNYCEQRNISLNNEV